METIFDYFLKFNVSLILVFLFYFLVLRRLTLYVENRFYFIVSLLLCLIIPLVNLGYFIYNDTTKLPTLIKDIPAVTITQIYVSSYKPSLQTEGFNYLLIIAFLYLLAVTILISRILLQIQSIYSLKRNASICVIGNKTVYKTDKIIAPFSFGKSIFINPELHTNAETNEILIHEMVHVKQYHVFDILFIEFVAVSNWFNPFVWVLKNSIKQNLEYIADSKVLSVIDDKKHYQYHLLKSTIQPRFSLTTPFNFLKLKTRILMMNKKNSPKKAIFRFALALPLFAILLFSFRTSLPKVLTLKSLQKVVPQKRAEVLIPKALPVKISDKEIEKEVISVSEKSYTIYGGIFDYKTSKPVQGVKVLLKESGEIAITNEDGYFEIVSKSLDKIKTRRTIAITYNNSTKEVWSPSESYSSTITDHNFGELRFYFIDTEKPEITTRFSGMSELDRKEAFDMNSIKKAFSEAMKRKDEAIEEYDVKKNFPPSNNVDTTKH